MNKLFNRAIAIVLTAAMVFGVAFVATPAKAEASEAALQMEVETADALEATATANKPYFPYKEYASTYNPYDSYKGYYAYVYPSGTGSTVKITNVKSNSSDIKAEASGKAIKVSWKDKACKAKITCKVNGVSLSFKLYIYKYENAFEAVKINKDNITKNFDKLDTTKLGKKYSKAKLTIKSKSNWAIQALSVYTNGKYKYYKYSDSSKKIAGVRKVQLGNFYINSKSYVYVYAVNVKTGVQGSWIIRY